MNIDELFTYFARVVTLLLVLPLHEAAHAFTAKRLGDDTAERQGRLTVNPFAHLDPLGSLLIILTGFGWAKPVPVNPMRMKKYRSGIALTALAGPVSNLLAAFVSALACSCVLATKSGYEAWRSSDVTPTLCAILLLVYLVQINVGLAVFNLLPIPPLDGFNVLRYYTSDKVDRWFYLHQREMQIGLLAFLVLLNVIPTQLNPLYYADKALTSLIWKSVSFVPAYSPN